MAFSGISELFRLQVFEEFLSLGFKLVLVTLVDTVVLVLTLRVPVDRLQVDVLDLMTPVHLIVRVSVVVVALVVPAVRLQLSL